MHSGYTGIQIIISFLYQLRAFGFSCSLRSLLRPDSVFGLSLLKNDHQSLLNFTMINQFINAVPPDLVYNS